MRLTIAAALLSVGFAGFSLMPRRAERASAAIENEINHRLDARLHQTLAELARQSHAHLEAGLVPGALALGR